MSEPEKSFLFSDTMGRIWEETKAQMAADNERIGHMKDASPSVGQVVTKNTTDTKPVPIETTLF